MQKNRKMPETLANGYSYESTRRELSNEYQHDRVSMVFKNICALVLWMKEASALEGLTFSFLLLPSKLPIYAIILLEKMAKFSGNSQINVKELLFGFQ